MTDEIIADMFFRMVSDNLKDVTVLLDVELCETAQRHVTMQAVQKTTTGKDSLIREQLMTILTFLSDDINLFGNKFVVTTRTSNGTRRKRNERSVGKTIVCRSLLGWRLIVMRAIEKEGSRSTWCDIIDCPVRLELLQELGEIRRGLDEMMMGMVFVFEL